MSLQVHADELGQLGHPASGCLALDLVKDSSHARHVLGEDVGFALVEAVLRLLGLQRAHVAVASGQERMQVQQVALHTVADIKDRGFDGLHDVLHRAVVLGAEQIVHLIPELIRLAYARTDLGQGLVSREELQVVVQEVAQLGVQPIPILSRRAQGVGLPQCPHGRLRGILRRYDDAVAPGLLHHIGMLVERLQYVLGR